LTNVVGYKTAGEEIAFMVADTVAIGFDEVDNVKCVCAVIFGTATEKDIVVHVFANAFITIKRMELPTSVAFLSELVHQ